MKKLFRVASDEKTNSALILIAFSFVFLWTFPSLGWYLTPRNFLGWFCILLCCFLAALQIFIKKRFFFERYWLFGLVPPAYLLLKLGVFGSQQPSTSILSFLMLSGLWLLIISLLNLGFRKKHWLTLWDVMSAVVLIGIILSIWLVPDSNQINYDMLLPFGLKGTVFTVFAGFKHPNLMASFLASLVLVNGVIILETVRQGKCYVSIFRYIIVSIFVATIYQSESLSGLMGLFVGSVVFTLSVWFSDRKKLSQLSKWWACVVLGFVFVLCAPSFFDLTNENEKFLQIEDKNSLGGNSYINFGFDQNVPEITYSHPVRLSAWSVSVQLIKEKPILGHGLGSFAVVFHEKFIALNADGDLVFRRYFTHPHSELFLILIEQGFIGLALIVLPWGYLAWRFISSGHKRSPYIICLITPIGLHTLVEMPLYLSGLHWLLIGMMVAWGLGHAGQKKRLAPQSRLRLLLPVMAFVCALFAGLMVQSAYIAHKAWVHIFQVYYPNLHAFVSFIPQRQELRHPFLGSSMWNRNNIGLAMSAVEAGEKDLLRIVLPEIEQNRTLFEGPTIWLLLSRAYILLDEQEKLAAHLQKVKSLSPKEYENLLRSQ